MNACARKLNLTLIFSSPRFSPNDLAMRNVNVNRGVKRTVGSDNDLRNCISVLSCSFNDLAVWSAVTRCESTKVQETTQLSRYERTEDSLSTFFVRRQRIVKSLREKQGLDNIETQLVYLYTKMERLNLRNNFHNM